MIKEIYRYAPLPNIIVVSLAGFLLSNIVYFNSFLSKAIGPLNGAIFSNFLGFLCLISWLLIKKSESLVPLVKKTLNATIFGKVALCSITSVGIVYFANLATDLVSASISIPLFVLFTALFSFIIELYQKTATPLKLKLLVFIVLFVFIYNITIGSYTDISLNLVLFATCASGCLVLSRALHHNLLKNYSHLESCIIVRSLVSVVALYLIFSNSLDLNYSNFDLRYLIAAIFGVLFQILMLNAISNKGHIVTNSSIQFFQIAFGWLTLKYEG